MPARTTGAGSVLLTAALASVALGLAASPASAASASVDFTGGSVGSLLVCKSQPSSSSISVTAGSTVTFGNHLGQTADLKVNGRSVGSVPANQARPVVFNASASVSMTFACSVGLVEKFSSISVSVTPAPKPAPAKPAPATGSGAGAAVAAPTTAAGTANRSGTTAGRTPSSAGTARATPNSTPPVAPGGVVPGAPGGPGAAGVPGGPAGVGPAAGDPALGDPGLAGPAGAVPGTGVGAGGAAAGDKSGTAEVAVGPLEPASGTPTSGPRGLLALIAAVCIVGVTFAAFRAILAQRASRTSFA
jgi:hypothetical protein